MLLLFGVGAINIVVAVIVITAYGFTVIMLLLLRVLTLPMPLYALLFDDGGSYICFVVGVGVIVVGVVTSCCVYVCEYVGVVAWYGITVVLIVVIYVTTVYGVGVIVYVVSAVLVSMVIMLVLLTLPLLLCCVVHMLFVVFPSSLPLLL